MHRALTCYPRPPPVASCHQTTSVPAAESWRQWADYNRHNRPLPQHPRSHQVDDVAVPPGIRVSAGRTRGAEDGEIHRGGGTFQIRKTCYITFLPDAPFNPIRGTPMTGAQATAADL